MPLSKNRFSKSSAQEIPASVNDLPPQAIIHANQARAAKSAFLQCQTVAWKSLLYHSEEPKYSKELYKIWLEARQLATNKEWTAYSQVMADCRSNILFQETLRFQPCQVVLIELMKNNELEDTWRETVDILLREASAQRGIYQVWRKCIIADLTGSFSKSDIKKILARLGLVGEYSVNMTDKSLTGRLDRWVYSWKY